MAKLTQIHQDSADDVQLLAGDDPQLKDVTLANDAGVLKRGTVIAMHETTGIWKQVALVGGSGVSTARAILAEDGGSDNREVQGFFVGKYCYKDLIFPAGATRFQKDAIILALKDRGIVIDADYSTTATTTTSSSSTTSSTS